MLLELKIENFALIARAGIGPGPGLNILTGETGAGKSILIQALGLLLGERSSGDQVGVDQNSKALVEGAFDLTCAPAALEWLAEHQIPLDEAGLIISRDVGAQGRSRVRLNGRMATTSGLRELGQLLVDMHGQHEHQHLMRTEAHRDYLDALGEVAHQDLREAVRDAHRAWKEAQAKLANVAQDGRATEQRLDMLRFQAEEIDTVAPVAGEDDELANERTRLANAEKLRELASACRDALNGEEGPGTLGLAHEALKAAQLISGTDTSVISWMEQLQSAIFEIEDVATQAAAYASTLESDPQRLEVIEDRLYQLNRLNRKYGPNLAGVLAHRIAIEEEIASITLSETDLEQLAILEAKAAEKFNAAAAKLTKSRAALSLVLGQRVEDQLKDLAMERARFTAQITAEEPGGAHGKDRVEFMLSANPGQPLRPLVRIASGGEISRVMLALRSVLRQSGPGGGVPIVIFDEIDTGIGGLTAEAVGQKMSEIARYHQVFCITHLPQIAKRAHHHFRVEKSNDAHNTSVRVVELDHADRVIELARMMGSESPQNLEHARILLSENATAVN